MTTLNIYLNFDGNCEEAFNFYKTIFGGEFSYLGRFGEMPDTPGHTVKEEEKEKIMHVGLPVGNSTLMGSDVGGDWAPHFKSGNNFSVSLNVDSKAEADRVFAALSDGGMAIMPMENTFWGDYFGMLTDKYGINWMVSFPTENQQ